MATDTTTTEDIRQLISIISKNHVVLYNNKIVDMGYIEGLKHQFKFGAMRIRDNLGTGQTPTTVGFIKTPKGEYFSISRDSASAKRIR